MVWDDLREARQRIGYQSTSRGWRYIPPSGPRVVPAPRAVYSGRPPYARAVYANTSSLLNYREERGVSQLNSQP